MQQAERTGIDPADAKAQLTEIWNRTDSGKAFAAAIAVEGWKLARGDRRDFVVLDPAGEAHSLGRRIEGAKAKDIRARMADIDPAGLPSVGEAKALHQARQVMPEQKKEAQHEPASTAPTPELAPQMEPSTEAQPAPARRAIDQDDQERHDPAITTTNASLVAQQQEAQRRFEQNSADLEEQRRAKSGVLDDLAGGAIHSAVTPPPGPAHSKPSACDPYPQYEGLYPPVRRGKREMQDNPAVDRGRPRGGRER